MVQQLLPGGLLQRAGPIGAGMVPAPGVLLRRRRRRGRRRRLQRRQLQQAAAQGRRQRAALARLRRHGRRAGVPRVAPQHGARQGLCRAGVAHMQQQLQQLVWHGWVLGVQLQAALKGAASCRPVPSLCSLQAGAGAAAAAGTGA